jgi:lipopolysaccharide/colanic/teichoic acid biosynthesis glycosyltransferase
MAKRLFDMLMASMALVLLSPLLLAAAIGIRLSGPGPIFYRARRLGRNGEPFVMHKFRTMRIEQAPTASAISARDDDRIFPIGRWLRRLKIDELPQLYDVLRGKMSIVGPRPEDPRIIRDHYAPEHWKTLAVRPGMASPGSIFNYTHGEKLIGQEDAERDYLEKVLPVKLALEEVYVREGSFWYDLRLIARTVGVIVLIALGRRQFRDPPEMARVGKIVPARTEGCCPGNGVAERNDP